VYIATVYMKAKKEGCWVWIVLKRQVGMEKRLLATCQSRVMIFLHSRLGIGGVGLEHVLHCTYIINIALYSYRINQTISRSTVRPHLLNFKLERRYLPSPKLRLPSHHLRSHLSPTNLKFKNDTSHPSAILSRFYLGYRMQVLYALSNTIYRRKHTKAVASHVYINASWQHYTRHYRAPSRSLRSPSI